MPLSMLERIAKLLNQAENAGTAAEAEVFMAKAQELSTAHSIDLAHARHATTSKQKTMPVQRNVFIGDAKLRGLRTICDLYLGIAEANDIRCTIAGNATMVYAVGFAEDIEVSEAMFASLQVQQAKALAEFKDAGEWRNEKVWSDRTYTFVPITWLTARLNFQAAYAARIHRRLLRAKGDAELAREQAERAAKATPHLDDDGALTDAFTAWFFDRHGLDLTEADETAVELTHAFSVLRSLQPLGITGVEFPDGEVLAYEPWVLEIFEDYLRTLESADDSGTALVLVEKRDAVREAAAENERRARGKYRGGTSGAVSEHGRSAGRAAADRANIGASTAIGGTRGSIAR